MTVTFKIIRDKQEKDLVANITESHEAELAAAESQPKMTAGTASSFGLRVQDLSPDLAHELGLDSGGVVISGVEPGSRGDEVGLLAHDVILEVNRSPVKDVSSYQQALKAGGKGSIVLLLVKRGDSTLYFALKPEA